MALEGGNVLVVYLCLSVLCPHSNQIKTSWLIEKLVSRESIEFEVVSPFEAE